MSERNSAPWVPEMHDCVNRVEQIKGTQLYAGRYLVSPELIDAICLCMYQAMSYTPPASEPVQV